ncbi:hypothetical protein [Streptomyces sp. NPDC006510]|uniref:hypothetical protein n=1 Tax=Streptomyces sp. NPDC006510 TaxID=3155600 RepID=UPI0033B59E4F
MSAPRYPPATRSWWSGGGMTMPNPRSCNSPSLRSWTVTSAPARVPAIAMAQPAMLPPTTPMRKPVTATALPPVLTLREVLDALIVAPVRGAGRVRAAAPGGPARYGVTATVALPLTCLPLARYVAVSVTLPEAVKGPTGPGVVPEGSGPVPLGRGDGRVSPGRGHGHGPR